MKEKDKNKYEYELAELRRKLNMMSEQVSVYEDRVNALVAEKQLLSAKLESAAKDSSNIRNIMTKNITESNQKQQALLSENNALKQEIRDIKK